jgi:hypothetical protein
MALKSLLDRFAYAFDRFAIVLRCLRSCFKVALRSLCNRFEIAPKSIRNRFGSLCNRF